MTTQHTPGPLTTEESWMLADRLPHLDLEGGAEVFEAVMTGSTHVVARVYGDGHTPQQQRTSAGRRAKIIAAAPEMRAQLLAMRSPQSHRAELAGAGPAAYCWCGENEPGAVGADHAPLCVTLRALLARIDGEG